MVFARFQMDCWERWNTISYIISILEEKKDNEIVLSLASILLTFAEAT